MAEAIICVGKLKERYWVDACAEYQKRLTKYAAFELIELPDLPEPVNSSDKIRAQIMDKEGTEILSRLRPTDYVVAMCIKSRQLPSEGLASLVDRIQTSGKRLVFVIGGSLGLSPAVTARADLCLSMSEATFPHQLFRVMLLEQLYRAHKILSGERYHK